MGESISDMLANTADWSTEVCDAIVRLVMHVEDEWENNMAKGEVGDELENIRIGLTRDDDEQAPTS